MTKVDVLELAALDRYKAYQRRWLIAGCRPGSTDAAWDWAEAYVRRSKVLERLRRYEPPKLIYVGNVWDLLDRERVS